MDFPISAQALADAALVVPATAWVRKMFPKLDGWLVVLVVAVLSILAGTLHAGDVDAGASAPGAGPTTAWLRAAGLHALLVFAAAFGGWNALRRMIERAVSTGAPPSIPPAAGLFLLFVLAAPVLAGCGASLQDAAAALNAANTIATEAQPCLVAERQREAAACNGDATCEATVTAHWAPVADAYDALHAGWCALVPDAEGCP